MIGQNCQYELKSLFLSFRNGKIFKLEKLHSLQKRSVEW